MQNLFFSSYETNGITAVIEKDEKTHNLIFFLSFPPVLDVTDEMLAFFLTLFQALRVQMGVAFTGQIIHTFLSMFTRLILFTERRRLDEPLVAAGKR